MADETTVDTPEPKGKGGWTALAVVAALLLLIALAIGGYTIYMKNGGQNPFAKPAPVASKEAIAFGERCAGAGLSQDCAGTYVFVKGNPRPYVIGESSLYNDIVWFDALAKNKFVDVERVVSPRCGPEGSDYEKVVCEYNGIKPKPPAPAAGSAAPVKPAAPPS